ncbi:MAG: hypothetical protein HY791_07245 [Deltaproteobacteria bacterium]|nr:hypothetical protein [Deltaproteobacteria bacterium]
MRPRLSRSAGLAMILLLAACPKKRTALDTPPPSRIVVEISPAQLESRWTAAVEGANARIQPAAMMMIPTSTRGSSYGGSVVTLFGSFDVFVTNIRASFPVEVIKASRESNYVSVGYLDPARVRPVVTASQGAAKSEPEPIELFASPASEPCAVDQDCVITTFPGCCESCPLDPYGTTKRQLEVSRRLCAAMDCRVRGGKCRPVASPDDFVTRCRASRCVAEPSP